MTPFEAYPDKSHWLDPYTGCSVTLRRHVNLAEGTYEWQISYDGLEYSRVTREDFLAALKIPTQMRYVALELLRRHVESDYHSKATYGSFPPRNKVSRCDWL